MKKLFLVYATATFLASCNSDSKSDMDTKKEVIPDTSAQYHNSVNTDTAKTAPIPLAAPLPAKTDSGKVVSKTKEKKTSTATKVTHEPATTTTTPSQTTTESPATTPTSPTTTTTTDNTQTTTSTPAVTPEKKGMKSSTKDAIIGGGAGAIGGAIISKKKGKGAIIGGILGAGAGYIIGKKKDKKDTAR
ncbi:MAG: YMGG-like glycine zipper-containing protein [Ginsengibacter sp.]